MTLYQAYVILQTHADWRKGKHDNMVKSEKLTEALELVLINLEKKLMKESHAKV